MMHDNQQTLIGQDKEIISMTHDTVGMYFGSETEEEDARQYVKMAWGRWKKKKKMTVTGWRESNS